MLIEDPYSIRAQRRRLRARAEKPSSSSASDSGVRGTGAGTEAEISRPRRSSSRVVPGRASIGFSFFRVLTGPWRRQRLLSGAARRLPDTNRAACVPSDGPCAGSCTRPCGDRSAPVRGWVGIDAARVCGDRCGVHMRAVSGAWMEGAEQAGASGKKHGIRGSGGGGGWKRGLHHLRLGALGLDCDDAEIDIAVVPAARPEVRLLARARLGVAALNHLEHTRSCLRRIGILCAKDFGVRNDARHR